MSVNFVNRISIFTESGEPLYHRDFVETNYDQFLVMSFYNNLVQIPFQGKFNLNIINCGELRLGLYNTEKTIVILDIDIDAEFDQIEQELNKFQKLFEFFDNSNLVGSNPISIANNAILAEKTMNIDTPLTMDELLPGLCEISNISHSLKLFLQGEIELEQIVQAINISDSSYNDVDMKLHTIQILLEIGSDLDIDQLVLTRIKDLLETLQHQLTEMKI